jgi:hypothetical protein
LDALKLFLLLFSSAVLTVSAQEEMMLWKPSLKLQWSDFKGDPPESKRIAATTASGISYSYSAKGNRGEYTLDFKVQTHFYPNKSWYHPELCDEVVLSHEQLHFDISELFARKLRGRLRDGSFSENVKAEVRELFAQVNEELSAFQNRYDLETDYSRNREAQAEWNRRISQMLRQRGRP